MPTLGLNWIHRRVEPDGVVLRRQSAASPGGIVLHIPRHRQAAGVLGPGHRRDPLPGGFRREPRAAPEVPIHFDPAGSVFVVFREPATPETQVVAREARRRSPVCSRSTTVGRSGITLAQRKQGEPANGLSRDSIR